MSVREINTDEFTIRIMTMVTFKKSAFIFSVFLICGIYAPLAQASTSAAGISPTRIVLPAGQRSASVTLTNTSEYEVAYRMQLIEMGLDDNGTFRVLSDSELPQEHRSSRPIIRFSPRQVRLKPGQSQVVRAIVRRSGLVEGEYRSHLRLQALPVLSDRSNDGEDKVLVNASATMQVGVTIPVIVRHQNTHAEVDLNSVKLRKNSAGEVTHASLLLGLSGNRSAFGDFSVTLDDASGSTEIGRLRGFALYYPYPEEWVNIPVSDVDLTRLGKGAKVRVRFFNRAIDSDKEVWLDEAIVPTFVE